MDPRLASIYEQEPVPVGAEASAGRISRCTPPDGARG
ncbi:MAG: hypothetical protein JWM18_3040 [Chloroflexi bacterium]|jgi:hypothetical protein|nr:hypothetical protein [Chloroflexota bacterium]MEA2616644.1 hypothetical protein [Chloroflexota bacterium]